MKCPNKAFAGRDVRADHKVVQRITGSPVNTHYRSSSATTELKIGGVIIKNSENAKIFIEFPHRHMGVDLEPWGGSFCIPNQRVSEQGSEFTDGMGNVFMRRPSSSGRVKCR